MRGHGMPWWVLAPILLLVAWAVAVSMFASSSAFARAWERDRQKRQDSDVDGRPIAGAGDDK